MSVELNKSPESAKFVELLSPIEPALALVEERLGQQFGAFDPGVAEYVRYAVSGQGKRLRPTLALLGGGACGGLGDDHIKLAVIVELIHIATLVHDDIMDGATLRRHRPTVSARWGNEVSVLLGDCLFAHALKLAASYPTNDVSRRIAHATNVVCEGEILQTLRRFDLNLSIEDYLKMVAMKTAELFAVSCELGAFLSGAPDAICAALRDYGKALGTAYQIYDDCVDIFEQETQAGKSLGTDLHKGKLTLPILTLLRRASPEERDQIALDLANQPVQGQARLVALVVKHQTLDSSIDTIEDYLLNALATLAPLPDSPHLRSLRGLAQYLLHRSRALAGHEQADAPRPLQPAAATS
jgi:octaprenyl-diphosphate synthase